MNTSTLPRHRFTGLQAIGYTSRGPIWPCMGGDETAEEATAREADEAAAKAASDAADAAKADADKADVGYPANTPLTEMTVEQRESYWKDKARRHETTWKSVIDKNLTPEQVLAMQTRLDEVERASMTDHEKALADARAEAKAEGAAEARTATADRIVAAEFKAALAGRRTPEQVAALIEPLTLSKFLTPEGEVDTGKVTTYAAGIAPAGNSKWPDTGQGNRGDTAPSKGVSSGRDLYASTHGKK